jgi:hypothetical protein
MFASMPEPTLKEVREELASIHEELLVLPADSYDRRAELKSRQHELRSVSARMVAEYQSDQRDALIEEFDRLHRLRDSVIALHVSPQATAVGFAGVQTDFNALVNRAIDAGADRAEIERKLKDVLRRLQSSG